MFESFNNIPDVPLNKGNSEKIESSEQEKIKELLAELEEQRRKNQVLREKILKYKKNGITELRKGESFYENLKELLESEMGEYLGDDIESLDNGALKGIVSRWDMESLLNKKISIIFGDMAFLSFANKEGHAAGNALLKSVGDITRKELGSPEIDKEEPENDKLEKESYFVGYRYGGDEFTGVVRDTLDGADKIARKFSLAVGNSEVEILKRYNLAPHIDVGTAHISEALEVFKELVDASIDIPKGNRVKRLQHILVNIADQRSLINKAKTRIKLLLSLREESPDVYEKIINFSRKGALETTDMEFDYLIENSDEFDKFVENKLAEELQKNKEELTFEKDIINKIARKHL